MTFKCYGRRVTRNYQLKLGKDVERNKLYFSENPAGFHQRRVAPLTLMFLYFQQAYKETNARTGWKVFNSIDGVSFDFVLADGRSLSPPGLK